jgi:hypothetical protein
VLVRFLSIEFGRLRLHRFQSCERPSGSAPSQAVGRSEQLVDGTEDLDPRSSASDVKTVGRSDIRHACVCIFYRSR